MLTEGDILRNAGCGKCSIVVPPGAHIVLRAYYSGFTSVKNMKENAPNADLC